MLTETEIMLVQASMYQNDNKHSLKSGKQHSYEAKRKKRHKCNTRHEKRTYPKTTELNVPTTPRCNVGCQSYKVDVSNELYSVWLRIFDKIEFAIRMPQI